MCSWGHLADTRVLLVMMQPTRMCLWGCCGQHVRGRGATAVNTCVLLWPKYMCAPGSAVASTRVVLVLVWSAHVCVLLVLLG